MRLGIIGGGRAAWAIGSAWQKAGAPLAGLALRDGSASRVPQLLGAEILATEDLVRHSDAVCVAVSDSALPQLAGRLAQAGGNAALFHLSGAVPSGIFAPHEPRFSLHPLRSLPAVSEAVSLAGTTFVFEGPPSSRTTAREIVSTLRGQWLEISSSMKPLYHAGAVIGSNLVAALLETASIVLQRAGIDEETVRPALASLARSAIENWSGPTPQSRFTGPAARADLATIEANLSALDREEWREIYRLLSLIIVESLRAGETDRTHEAVAARLRLTPG
jgi:predicted short-subunit dehydrogenase-like oxidoreductase (DUF2520 family)